MYMLTEVPIIWGNYGFRPQTSNAGGPADDLVGLH